MEVTKTYKFTKEEADNILNYLKWLEYPCGLIEDCVHCDCKIDNCPIYKLSRYRTIEEVVSALKEIIINSNIDLD